MSESNSTPALILATEDNQTVDLRDLTGDPVWLSFLSHAA